MMDYTYNPVSQVLEYRTSGDDTPVFVPLLDYAEDMCKAFGVGVGQSGIVTSTGPFHGTMKTLDRLISKAVVVGLNELLTQNPQGNMQELTEIFEECALPIKATLTSMEVKAKLGMYSALAANVRVIFQEAA